MAIEELHVASTVPGIPGRRIRVYTPPGFASGGATRYPVLYMHDGQNVFAPGGEYGCWFVERAADEEIRAGRIPPLLIAAIDNDGFNRRAEYVPPGNRYKEWEAGRADAYGRFVIEDVMPAVNRAFPTLTGPAHTAIAGSSLGGVVSLYLGFSTGVFGRVGSMSTAICWAPSFMRGIPASPHRPARIYHDIGTAEPQDMFPDNYDTLPAELDRILQTAGYIPGRDLRYVVAEDAHHHESAWASRTPDMLRWLFGTP